MTLSPELLNAIEAGCDGVTPGPWAYEPYGDTGQYGVGLLVAPDPDGETPLSGYVSSGYGILVEAAAPEVEGAQNAAHIARLDPATVLELVAGYRAWLASEERNKLYRQALSSADAFTATLNPNLLPEGAAQQWEATREALRRAEVPHV
jgi:hypothetical protein